MRRPSVVAAALVLFVLGGAVGGWWYLSAHLVGKAEAQVTSSGNCRPGGNCLVGALDVGTSGPGAAFVKSEASSTIPLTFDATDLVVGRAASSGASSGAVFARYDSTNNVGFLGSLSPGTAWRVLRLGASEVIVQDGTGAAKVTIGANTNPGDISATGTFTSSEASGANGFACATNGCRFDFGAGASDYLYSTGTNVAAAVAFQSDSFASVNGVGLSVKGAALATTDNVNIDTSAVTLTTGRILVLKNNGTEKAAVLYDGTLDFVGVATGSLPAAATYPGGVQYDTSTSTLKYSNGSSWVSLTADTNTLAEEVCGYSPSNAEETTFAGKWAENAGTLDHLTFTVTTAGSGAGNGVLEVLCDGSQIATLTVPCATVAGTVGTGDVAGAVTAGCTVKLQWDSSSACTTLPIGNACATWE